MFSFRWLKLEAIEVIALCNAFLQGECNQIEALDIGYNQIGNEGLKAISELITK